MGLFFLIFAQYKIFGTQFTLHGGFQFWINKFLNEGGAYPFMEPILRGFLLPHATPIAFLVAYGEFAIGLALILGVFIQAASAVGLVLCSRCFSRPTTRAPPRRCGSISAPA